MSDLERMNVDEVQLDRELVEEEGLAAFVKLAWHLVEPGTPLLWNWHLDMICRVLEAVTKGHILRLIINVPPGSMKSLLVCVFWQAWAWRKVGGEPALKWMITSYDGTLTLDQSTKVQDILTSEWYRERWGHDPTEGRSDSNSLFYNAQGGLRFSTSFQGKATGRHVDIQIADDPIKPKDTEGGLNATRAVLEMTNSLWRSTFASRAANPKTFRRVIIMQRLHEADLAGEEIKSGEYVHLCIPMEFEPDRRCVVEWEEDGHKVRLEDPRQEDGELMWPERFDAEWVRIAKGPSGMGQRVYAAQCQQRPAPAGGSVFDMQYVQHWKPGQLPPNMHMVQSWDCTFKGEQRSDDVVGQVWGAQGANFYLIDQKHGKFNVNQTCAAIRAMRKQHPRAVKVLIEDAANGPAVVDMLKKQIPGLSLVKPLGGKVARANAVQPLWEAFNVWLPHPQYAGEWVPLLENQLEFFPHGRHDDMVDTMTQALNYLYGKSHHTYMEAVKAMHTGR